MPKAFNVTFPNGHTASAANVQNYAELVEALIEMGLNQPRPTIVLVGGAAGLQSKDLERLRPLFAEALVPLAHRLDAAVIDGGTDTGVMALMGQSRNDATADFPLIGVLPASMVTLSDKSQQGSRGLRVEPNHSHFILVPGSLWGDETAWMTSTVEAMTGDGACVTVLLDGGETAWEDVAESVRAERPVIVVGGSGRVADILAAALGGAESDQRALGLARSGFLQSVRFEQGPAALIEAITGVLSAP